MSLSKTHTSIHVIALSFILKISLYNNASIILAILLLITRTYHERITFITVNNGLASKIGASGTVLFSASTGIFGNLSVSNLLTQTRMYVKYTPGSGQTINVGANTLQFPTASITTNVSRLTVSGTNNTTFTNTSGVTKLWSVTAVGFAYNTDVAKTARLTTSVFLNGSTTGIANSIFTPYSATVGGGPQCSGILSVANGDSITVVYTTGVMTTSTAINSATVFIVEVRRATTAV